jgi:hypothetical protein
MRAYPDTVRHNRNPVARSKPAFELLAKRSSNRDVAISTLPHASLACGEPLKLSGGRTSGGGNEIWKRRGHVRCVPVRLIDERGPECARQREEHRGDAKVTGHQYVRSPAAE